MQKIVESKFKSFIQRQNSVRKCGCNQVMRDKDFQHHNFFCSIAGESLITDNDVSSLMKSEQLKDQPESLAA